MLLRAPQHALRVKPGYLSQSTIESSFKRKVSGRSCASPTGSAPWKRAPGSNRRRCPPCAQKLAASAPMRIKPNAVEAPLDVPQPLSDRFLSLGTVRRAPQHHSPAAGRPALADVVDVRPSAPQDLTSPQKNMLWLGIGLDCFSKISLLREIVRFAQDDLGWFFMVLLFFLTTSTLVTVYWLHHYPPIAPRLPDKKEPRVYGLTKHDVRRLVRKTGAIFSFLHMGTVRLALPSGATPPCCAPSERQQG